jgi:hypothetical protein
MRIIPANRFDSKSTSKWNDDLVNVELFNTLDAVLEEDELGLRLLSLGDSSPLRNLDTLEQLFCGMMEIGDRIVAINGVSTKAVDDLKTIRFDKPSCEVSIFDYRTRRIVSWSMSLADSDRKI